MPLVEEYWDGVLRRLQAEVDVFARLVRHQGERGRENELAFVRLLQGLVPRRYGLGSGMLIDSADRFAKQTDIVVFDQSNEPTILAQTTQLLFPVEQVRVCVEVKTTLTKEEVKDCGKKKAALLDLKPTGGGDHPLFVVLAYHADASPVTFAMNFRELPEEHRPDLLCVLDPGVIGGPAERFGLTGCGFHVGLALLHERDDNKQRISRQYRRPQPDQHDDALVGDAVYPVTTDANRRPVIGEPARALLLFCESLLVSLAERDGQPVPSLTHYLTPLARELEPCGS